MNRIRAGLPALAAVTLFSAVAPPARAAESDVTAIRAEIAAMRADYEARIAALEARVAAAEASRRKRSTNSGSSEKRR